MIRPVIAILGPRRGAASGIGTHVGLLMDSGLRDDFELVHFRTPTEGLLRLLASPFALFATILFRQVSVVHINTALTPRAFWRDLAYLAVAKLLRARVIYQLHGGALPQNFAAGRPRLARFLRWTLLLPELVMVQAKSELDAYRQFVPGQQLLLLPNGIDVKPYAGIPTVMTRPDHPLRLAYIGRLAREKGLYETLQGVRLALELGVDVRLVVAGQGLEEARLRRYAQALGIATRVTFAGAVAGRDKVTLLAGSDVMLLPSYAEGLPYALLEAMAAGVPVIATPVGAVPDVVTEGTHGCLVPTRDGKAMAQAIAYMAADRERLSWMSRACRLRVRAAYSIQRVASELALQYGRLAGDVVLAGAGPTALPSAAPRINPKRNMPAGMAGRKD